MLTVEYRQLITMLSPYVKGYDQFIPIYEQRVMNNQPYPGEVYNLTEYTNHEYFSPSATKNKHNFFHFFDQRVAKQMFENSGFIVEQVMEMTLAYPSKFCQVDGRENVGVIAIKPE